MGLSYYGKNSELFGTEKKLTFSLVRTFFLRNRIVTVFPPRMATQNSFYTKISAIKRTMNFQSFHKIT